MEESKALCSIKIQQPVIGAAVVVEKTTIGAATDINGKFSIAGIQVVKSTECRLLCREMRQEN